MNIMRFKKISISLVLLLFLIGLGGFYAQSVQAAGVVDAYNQAKEPGIDFVPQTSIPGSEFQRGIKININSATLPNYISAIYRYGVGLVAVLAVMMIMVGGFVWIFAAGNPQRIGTAKGMITSALVGLFLALGSVMLLRIINPNLVDLKPLDVRKPEIKITGCPGVVTTCNSINNLTMPTEEYKGTTYTDVNKFRYTVCTPAIYNVECGLPNGLCYWLDSSDKPTTNLTTGKCTSLLDVKCTVAGLNTNECFGFYCATDGWNKCSFGTVGSQCNNKDECATGFCNTRGNNYCTNGKAGDKCWNNKECDSSGYECKDGLCTEKG